MASVLVVVVVTILGDDDGNLVPHFEHLVC